MLFCQRKRSLKSMLQRAGLEKLQLNTQFLNAEFSVSTPDKDAAWELYVEMLTRIITQPLPSNHGDEKTALESVYSLFSITREILKNKGRHCIEFTKVAVPVLNQIVRPFTAKWHRRSIQGAFEKKDECNEFRNDLDSLQKDMKKYTRLLADIAEVEDLTELEEE